MQSNYNAPPPNRYPAPSPRPPPAQNAPVYARNDPRSSYPPLNPPPPMSNGYSQGPSRPPSGYPLYPPPAASPSRPPPPTHASHLPPPGHVGMMQHQQQQQQRPGQPPPQLSQGFMPPSQSSRPPYEAPGYPPAAANGNAQGYGSGLEGVAKDVGSLLAMLVSIDWLAVDMLTDKGSSNRQGESGT